MTRSGLCSLLSHGLKSQRFFILFRVLRVRSDNPLACQNLSLWTAHQWRLRYTLVTEEGEKKTSIGFTGKATANYANGDIYEGQFENGIRQGSGVYTCLYTTCLHMSCRYLKGDVFTGSFENNLKTGLGRISYKKGGFFHGQFKDGQRNGEGTLQYANGDIYSGEWKDGKKHGPGTCLSRA